MGLVAERQVLRDAIHIGLMNRGGATEIAPALGIFGLRQVAFTRACAQDFSAGGDFESLGHGLLRFNTFWTSHKSEFLSKRARNIGSGAGQCKRLIGLFGFGARRPKVLHLGEQGFDGEMRLDGFG